jgi:hypothetical protein
MRARFFALTAVAALLWTGESWAQSTAPTAPPAAAAASAKPASPAPDKSAASDSSAPDDIKATSEISSWGTMVGVPSTGSDDSSPAPLPGSPPTAPR